MLPIPVGDALKSAIATVLRETPQESSELSRTTNADVCTAPATHTLKSTRTRMRDINLCHHNGIYRGDSAHVPGEQRLAPDVDRAGQDAGFSTASTTHRTKHNPVCLKSCSLNMAPLPSTCAAAPVDRSVAPQAMCVFFVSTQAKKTVCAT